MNFPFVEFWINTVQFFFSKRNTTLIHIYIVLWACLAERFNASEADGLIFLDILVDPGSWLRSRFESPRRQLVLGLFQDPFSYGRFTGATFHVPYLD